MDKKTLSFQREQAAAGAATTGNADLCGKEAEPAALQDELTGALIGLVRATDGYTAPTEETYRVIIEGLYASTTCGSFDNEAVRYQIGKVWLEKEKLVPECSRCAAPCGRNAEYDMEQLWNADKDVRSLKARILFEIRKMAAYAYHAMLLGYSDMEICDFFCEALFRLGYEDTTDGLLPVARKVGEMNPKCIALLDKANAETCGAGFEGTDKK